MMVGWPKRGLVDPILTSRRCVVRFCSDYQRGIRTAITSLNCNTTTPLEVTAAVIDGVRGGEEWIVAHGNSGWTVTECNWNANIHFNYSINILVCLCARQYTPSRGRSRSRTMPLEHTYTTVLNDLCLGPALVSIHSWLFVCCLHHSVNCRSPWQYLFAVNIVAINVHNQRWSRY